MAFRLISSSFQRNILFQFQKRFNSSQPSSNTQIVKEYPFYIKRSLYGQLPVYTKYTHAGSKKTTIVRKYEGDVPALKAALRKLIPDAKITEKVGRLEIDGIHSQTIKKWLTDVGF